MKQWGETLLSKIIFAQKWQGLVVNDDATIKRLTLKEVILRSIDLTTRM